MQTGVSKSCAEVLSFTDRPHYRGDVDRVVERREGANAPGTGRQPLDAAEQDHVLLADRPIGRPRPHAFGIEGGTSVEAVRRRPHTGEWVELFPASISARMSSNIRARIGELQRQLKEL